MTDEENTEQNSLDKDDFNFDLDKMKSAVNAPYHMLPKGLTYEEYTAWLKSKVSKS
jgi:hypothetical protein